MQKEMPIIYGYGLDEAIHDEVLIPLWKERWPLLSAGKPIVATAAVRADITDAGLIDIWNEFARWQAVQARRRAAGELVDREVFKTKVNGDTIWVIEDGAALTILYPSDY